MSGKLLIQNIHDCQPPSMIVGTSDRVETKGVWPFRKKVTVTDNIYEDRRAKFVCRECGSEWDYHPWGNLWRCTDRVTEWVVG